LSFSAFERFIHVTKASKMKKITFTPIFNLRKKLNKSGEAVITVKAYQDGRSKYFSTHLYVKPSQWNKRRLEIKNHPNEEILNKQIQDKISEFKAIQTDVIGEKGFCTFDDWLNYTKIKRFPCFLAFFEDELENDSTIKESTRVSRRATLNYLKEYRAKILFRQLTYSFISDFHNYLYQIKLGKTTIAKHHKIIKFYIKRAILKNYLKENKNPYIGFKYDRGKSKPRTFLTNGEIERVEQLTFEPHEESLKLIRDFFLFSIYTGIRFSDLSKLSKTHFVKLDKGLEMKINMQKSDKNLGISLFKLFPEGKGEPTKPEKIIYTYLEQHSKQFNNHPFYEKRPFLKGFTNQYFNRILKVLMERAKVKKQIGSHNARHTFGAHMATKVSPFVLKELMGHSKIDTTQIYVNLSRQLIDNELDKIKW